jgi:hypothetical protein
MADSSAPRRAPGGLWPGVVLIFLILGLAGCRKATAPPSAPTGPTPAESAAALEALSDRAPVRVAWLEGPRLYYFDSMQPAPPRVMRESSAMERPVFAPDGAALVVTDHGRMVALSLPVGEEIALGEGHAFAAVREPTSNTDWVYAAESADGHRLFRFPLQAPAKREPIWDHSPIDPRTAQVSGDGQRLAGKFFGVDGGTADRRDGSRMNLSGGRPLALAPDASHLAAMLDGTGRRLRFFHPSGLPWDRQSDDLSPPARWQAELPEAPWAGPETRHSDLRWSQHPRFIALSQPGDTGPGRLTLARLSPNADRVESLAVLAASGPDVRGVDAWVGGGAAASLSDWPPSPPTYRPPAEDADGAQLRWPRSTDGLSFLWDTRHELNHLPNRATPCRLTPRGTARFGEWGDLLLDGGTFEADDESAKAVATMARASRKFALQLLLTESTDEQGPLSIRLAALQLSGNRDAFSLSRVDHALVFRALLDPGDGTPPREYQNSIAPLAITPARPFHVLIELNEGKITWTIDGQQVGDTHEIGPASLAGWNPGEVTRLVFGDDAMRTTVGWRARMEKILILDRMVPFAELRDDRANAAASTSRRVGAVTRVRATLLEAAPLPNIPPDDTRPQLVQHLYQVKEVLSGQLKVDPLVVWHWATLDGKPVVSLPKERGATYDLRVSTLLRHQEVELEETHLGPLGLLQPAYLDVAAPQFPPTLAPAASESDDDMSR